MELYYEISCCCIMRIQMLLLFLMSFLSANCQVKLDAAEREVIIAEEEFSNGYSHKHKFIESKQQNNEYEIAYQVLKDYTSNGIYLFAPPLNTHIEKYMSGFSNDSIDLNSYTFKFLNNKTDNWDINNEVFARKLKGKIFIEGIEATEQIPFHNPDLMRLSNVAFSTNRKYAIVYFNHYSIGMEKHNKFIGVFKRKNNEWVYVTKFLITE